MTDPGYICPLDADPPASDLGRELHMNGVHTHCPAHCLTMWDTDGNDRYAWVKDRAIAWDRPPAEPCQASTIGCSIDHSRDHGPCETW